MLEAFPEFSLHSPGLTDTRVFPDFPVLQNRCPASWNHLPTPLRSSRLSLPLSLSPSHLKSYLYPGTEMQRLCLAYAVRGAI